MPSFRLTTILWAMALLAASMATFGSLGIFVACVLLAAWAAVFRTPRTTISEWCVIIAVAVVLILLLLPPFDVGRESSRQAQCINHLHQVTKALQIHERMQDSFPAARGSENAPPHSWRLAILPQIDEQSLWQSYRFDEPWDSPHNSLVGDTPVNLFACPSDPTHSLQSRTNYLAVVGPEAAWLPERGRARDEFKDGLWQTILLIDVPGRDVPWSQPADLTFEEAVDLLTTAPSQTPHSRTRNPGFFYKDDQQGVLVAFANGRVDFLHLPLSKDLATALLTIDGGETIDENQLNRLTQPQLDLAKCYAFAGFVALAVAPAWRLLRRPRQRA